MTTPFPTYDILVLGAGLAGLRAALAACEAAPGCRVAIATLSPGPSGSSFANRNARLGLLAPEHDDARQALSTRIMTLASPGTADPALVRILIEESTTRSAELVALGAPVDRGPDGEPMRHPCCFFRQPPSALLLTDLGQAYTLLAEAAGALGAVVLPGRAACHLLREPQGRICGATFMPTKGGEPLAIRAAAVVIALGGPARLFERSIAGPDVPGTSYGLLAEAGAELAGAGFMQFQWAEAISQASFPVHTLAQPGAGVAGPDGNFRPLPPEVSQYAAKRSTHWPIAWGQPDAALDHALATHLDDEGMVLVRTARGQILRIAPHAQCGNGGARIAPDGATTVPGLYAAGECATGMHGADRVGGAMAAAALVFGSRAGTAAAHHAAGAPPTPAKLFNELTKPTRPLPPTVAENVCNFPPPIPSTTLRDVLLLNRYPLKILEQNIILELLGTSYPVHRAALVSALTVVQNLHSIA